MTDAAPSPPNEPVLLRDDADGVATLTLNRPAKYNALSEELIGALQAALDSIAADEAIRVVILGAAGKAFCPGHDLKDMRSPTTDAAPDQAYYRALFADSTRMTMTIGDMPQPVIARVQGIATAAGCQLVAACDLAVAADDARFATNGIANGLFCSTPAVALSRNVAPKHAFEMLFTGEFIDAQAARALARSIAAMSPVTVRSGKALFYKQLPMGQADAYAVAAENMARDMTTQDAAEGIDAFLKKRKPVWRGK